MNSIYVISLVGQSVFGCRSIVGFMEANNESDVSRYIEEHYKTNMLKRGEWRATNEEKISEKVIGFHLNSLYSPVGWLSWEACLQNYEMAKDENSF